MDDPLLQPFSIRHLELRNRIFSSSHEPAYGELGMPKERYRLYHVEKAKGGVAMTMTAGGATVSVDSPPAFGNLHAFDDGIVPWIREMTDELHEHGTAVMIQLSHLGRRTTYSKAEWLPVVAASPLAEPAHRAMPKEAEEWDLERIISDYADAAERMKAGGMDGLELECYGHFIDQFWSPITNVREDEYGGSLENRMKIPLSIFRAVRERTGDDFIVGTRIAIDETKPGGIRAEAGMQIVKMLEDEGLIDFVNVIRGYVASDVDLTEVIPIHGMPSAPHLDFAGRVREATDLPVLHASKIDDVATARHAIAEGKLDMVGMTRAHIADPYIVRKITEGREAEIRPCVGATYCLDRIYEAGEALCLHNAATSREATMPHVIARASGSKRVVVVGAGPGGLEAARVAAERGHSVLLLEAMPWTGGQVRLAARNPRRRDLLGIIDWRDAELARLGVEVRCDTFAEVDDIASGDPDIVVIATGGLPSSPGLQGLAGEGDELTHTSWDVIGGDVRPTGDVLMWDEVGTHSSLTAAELMATSGANLEIITPERMLGIDVGGMNHVPYARAFNEHSVRITLNQRVLAVRQELGRLCVEIGSDHSSHVEARHVDYVISDRGTVVNADLYFELKPESTNLGAVDYGAFVSGDLQSIVRNEKGSFQLFRIGDAVSGRNIHAAIYDGLRLMKGL